MLFTMSKLHNHMVKNWAKCSMQGFSTGGVFAVSCTLVLVSGARHGHKKKMNILIIVCLLVICGKNI